MQLYKQLLLISDKQDRKNFVTLCACIILLGILSAVSIGMIAPIMTFLLYPDKAGSIALLQGFSYQSIVLIFAGVFVTVFYIKNFVAYLTLKALAHNLYHFAFKLSNKLFAQYLHASYEFHVQRNTAELIRNITNESAVLCLLIESLGMFINEFIVSAIIYSFLVYYSPLFSLVIGGIFAVITYIFLSYTKKIAEHYAQLRSDSWNKMVEQVMHALGSIKELTIYNRVEFFYKKFIYFAHQTKEAGAFKHIYSQAVRMIIECVGIAAIMLYICILVVAKVPSEQILALLSVIGIAAIQLLPSINRMLSALTVIRYSRNALNIFSAELAACSEHSVALQQQLAFKHAIDVKNISLTIDNKNILTKINFSIKKGKKIAIIGKTGSGKSTVANILLGLLQNYTGEILIDNNVLAANNIKSWQQLLGYVPQQIYLLNASVRENIAIGIQDELIDDNKIWALLKLVQLDVLITGFADGLQQNIGDNGVKLSGGQRQRLGIARALYHDPAILIMDEATSSLDNKTEADITCAINNAARNRTMLIIAHRLSTIQDSDNIIVLDSGKIVAQGNYQELLAQQMLTAESAEL